MRTPLSALLLRDGLFSLHGIVILICLLRGNLFCVSLGKAAIDLASLTFYSALLAMNIAQVLINTVVRALFRLIPFP